MYGLQLVITLFLTVIVIWNIVLITHPFHRKKLGAKIFPKGARAGKGIKQIRSTESFQYKMGQVFLYFYTPISIYTIFYLILSKGSWELVAFGLIMVAVSLASYTMFSNVLEVREKGILIYGVNVPISNLQSWTWAGHDENRLRVYQQEPIFKLFKRVTTTELPLELKEDLQDWLKKNK
ncbi:hypothetical protein SAMN05877753_10665 [Bacillus oleivorans]|uniref:DUF5673 domain-containing protein n=1 Tax=Bacillus oleivorans TaxID=1448271 RepID=A0A285CZE2_9BACI|nr:hypothetical protein [Bacillus oleivorans]SNX72438.1 hypothetical protein SAMN05877753_10665 [Bacillus oleivorans]